MLPWRLAMIDKSTHTHTYTYTYTHFLSLFICLYVDRIPNSHSRKRQLASDLQEPNHTYCVIRGVSVYFTLDSLKESTPVPV